MGPGFLGMGAPWSADFNLVVQLAMGLALLGGAGLARAQRFKAHKACQMSVVLLNLVLIVSIMAPSFRLQVAPRFPGGLGDAYHLVAFVHGLLGVAAELLALYVILVAGTNWLPEGVRFQDYRPWMRATLGLWWAVIGIGLVTYGVWYAPAAPDARPRKRPPVRAPSSNRVEVKVEGFAFSPREVRVKRGTVVAWSGLNGRHSVEADDGSFKADAAAIDAGHYEHRFDKSGEYRYSCEFHGDKRGKGMSGIIRVE